MLFIDDIFGDNIYNILSSKAVYRFCRKEGMYMRFTIEHLVKRDIRGQQLYQAAFLLKILPLGRRDKAAVQYILIQRRGECPALERCDGGSVWRTV